MEILTHSELQELSKKQQQNRAYHARNAEKIREKKRQQYEQKAAKSQDEKPDSELKPDRHTFSFNRNRKLGRAVTQNIEGVNLKKMEARRNIEYYLDLKKIDEWF